MTDNLGSIIAVFDNKLNRVFEASYDAWGRQTVKFDEIGLYRGFTGHENVGRSELVNMNHRVYDSSIGRFLSPDNYVQLPENSQSFNRYSYCINNPLKYTDPTGQFFQIGFIGAALLAADAFANAMTTDSGSKFFISSAISIFSPAVSGAIGSIFGATGNFGHELLRAGAHGLASGVQNALTGDNFGVGFASGAFASFAGSGAQWAGLGKGGVLGATTLFGGIGSAVFGGDFLDGAMTGLQIGFLNDLQHMDGDLMGKEARCKKLPDGTFVAPGELPSAISIAHPHINLTLTAPVEKGLELVSPEFDILTGIRAIFNGALKATFSVSADGCRFINEQRKPWIRIKPSYSKVNGVKTRSITWGSNAHYRDKKIINPILRKLNENIRNYKIPIDSWRTADPGHFHLYRLK